jgi:putative nucleotidyltransferase with HDIG domain
MNQLEILKKNISNQNLVKHCLAVKAIMEELAGHFGSSPHLKFECGDKDKEKWGTAGLLHDIDYERTKDDPSHHSLVGAQMLEELGFDKDICQAVKTHNEAHGIKPETLMEKALFVSDPLTGLIVAATLVLPSKKIADLSVENVLNRFGEKSFARGANREIIKKCEELLNLNLAEFVAIGLKAMKRIASELGL